METQRAIISKGKKKKVYRWALLLPKGLDEEKTDKLLTIINNCEGEGMLQKAGTN